VLPV
jgi:N-acetylglucosamine-6-sulfatase